MEMMMTKKIKKVVQVYSDNQTLVAASSHLKLQPADYHEIYCFGTDLVT